MIDDRQPHLDFQSSPRVQTSGAFFDLEDGF
jgi:hypothetical protein